LAEAQRLTRVPRDTIRRWTQGYVYRSGDDERFSPPVIGTDVPPVEGTPVLDFSDLLEVRFLDAFRRYGVSLRVIRLASRRAQELLGRTHPFSTRIFKTDGQTILAEIVRGTEDPLLLDLVRDQFEFKRIVDPHLYRGIEYDELHEPMRWWPLGKDRHVVVDPERAFGNPIVMPGAVPTSILAWGLEAEGSEEVVARWYDVPVAAVRDAAEFESGLSA
jgi:uncharacterized protein (DUF433 family)